MEFSPLFFQILKNWWWVLFPTIMWFPAKSLYLWWIRWEVFYKKQFKWILVEIKPPREILKPFSAMENVFSMLWGIIDTPNWRERWCGGELPLGGGGWYSCEIASFGGEIHFYMRIPAFFRNALETAIYSQYPEAEITQVEDYTKNVPRNIPNEKWDLYSEDYSLLKEDYYPIKTYSMFFEREAEERRLMEEKRIDPINSLLEALSKLQPGEQIWFQIVCNPIVESIFPWISKGRAAADRIAKRISSEKPKSILQSFQEALELLIKGQPAEKKPAEKPLELVAPELRLTPGEREILHAIENKIKKYGYQCWIRQIYLCKKDEPHSYGNYKLIREYLMSQFMAQHLNSFMYYGPTRTRIHYLFKDRRLYLRKRQQLRRYIERMPSLWPRTMTGEPLFPFGHAQGRKPGIRATIVLNIEELATIYHFPAKIVTPALAPIESKKAGPPPGLPTE